MSKRFAPPLDAALRACLALCLAALPFELTAGLAVGPLTLTNVELLLLAVAGLWAALLAAERRGPAVPAWAAAGAAALVGALLLGAALAGEGRAEALKFALRQGQGALLGLCVADTLRRGGGAGPLAGALLGGAGLSAALGLAEMSEAPAVMAALAPFKTESTYMGGLLRLSATFSYANTAAQYYEALLPLAVAVAAGAAGAARGPGAWARRALPAALLLATLLTYSRAALATTGLLLALTPAAAWLAGGARLGRRAALACAGLAALAVGLGAASPTFRLRLAEPDVADWYSARYEPAALAPMAPNELRSVSVTVHNSGRVGWDSGGLRPVRLAYHWLDATTGRVVRFEGRRTLLPHSVPAGSSVTLRATVHAPERPGRYVLAWDMLREYIGRGWFSQMGVPPGRVVVEVGGAAPPGASPAPPERPAAAASLGPQPGPPGRRELWGAALAIWRERPLVGIGPDRFRHVYGPRLGLAQFDDRIHTNNLYLELLVGAGLLGAASFLALAGAALAAGGRALAAGGGEPGPRLALLLGATVGLAAFLAHGLLDVFLAFTPTYALMWALIGAVAGLSGGAK